MGIAVASNPSIQLVNPTWPSMGSASTSSGSNGASDPGSGGVDLAPPLAASSDPSGMDGWGPLSSGKRSPSPMVDFDWIACFYDNEGFHGALGDLSPGQFAEVF